MRPTVFPGLPQRRDETTGAGRGKSVGLARRILARSLATYLVLATLSLAIACGPTSQVRIERHLQCDTTGRDCQTIETAKEEPTASGWAMFALLLLAIASSGR